jgi:hypothetical protein
MMAGHVRAPVLLLPLILLIGAPGFEAQPLEEKLRVARTDSAVPFTVIYDDIHTVHGGTSISVSRDGAIERVDVAPGRRNRRVTKGRATPEQLAALLDLLIEVEAWEQKIPAREMRHDESKARLAVSAGGQPGGFWEFYNDLESNGRLTRVKARLEELAPRKETP